MSTKNTLPIVSTTNIRWESLELVYLTIPWYVFEKKKLIALIPSTTLKTNGKSSIASWGIEKLNRTR